MLQFISNCFLGGIKSMSSNYIFLDSNGTSIFRGNFGKLFGKYYNLNIDNKIVEVLFKAESEYYSSPSQSIKNLRTAFEQMERSIFGSEHGHVKLAKTVQSVNNKSKRRVFDDIWDKSKLYIANTILEKALTSKDTRISKWDENHRRNSDSNSSENEQETVHKIEEIENLGTVVYYLYAILSMEIHGIDVYTSEEQAFIFNLFFKLFDAALQVKESNEKYPDIETVDCFRKELVPLSIEGKPYYRISKEICTKQKMFCQEGYDVFIYSEGEERRYAIVKEVEYEYEKEKEHAEIANLRISEQEDIKSECIAKFIPIQGTKSDMDFIAVYDEKGIPYDYNNKIKELKFKQKIKCFINLLEKVNLIHDKGYAIRSVLVYTTVVGIVNEKVFFSIIDFQNVKIPNIENTILQELQEKSKKIRNYAAPELMSDSKQMSLDDSKRIDIYNIGNLLKIAFSNTDEVDNHFYSRNRIFFEKILSKNPKERPSIPKIIEKLKYELSISDYVLECVNAIHTTWPNEYIVNSIPIGEGGFAPVFEAESAIDGTALKYAIKVIRKNSEEEAVKAMAEIGLQENVACKHIVKIIRCNRAFVDDKWYVFIVMPRFKGDLATYIRNNKNITTKQRQEITKKVCESICGALEYCHEKKILHNDVKPQNILFDEREDFYLSDFGIASHIEENENGVSGSEYYKSPDKKVSERSDIYSLGIVLYSIINGGKMPYEDEGISTYEALALREKNKVIPPIQSKLCNKRLNDAIIKACEYNPEDRYNDVNEMKQAVISACEIDDRKILPVKRLVQVSAVLVGILLALFVFNKYSTIKKDSVVSEKEIDKQEININDMAEEVDTAEESVPNNDGTEYVHQIEEDREQKISLLSMKMVDSEGAAIKNNVEDTLGNKYNNAIVICDNQSPFAKYYLNNKYSLLKADICYLKDNYVDEEFSVEIYGDDMSEKLYECKLSPLTSTVPIELEVSDVDFLTIQLTSEWGMDIKGAIISKADLFVE